MSYSLVTSLVDTPGAPPPVQWRVTTVGLSGNKSFGLDIVGVCSTNRLELQRRLDAGLMQIYREIEGNHMTDLAYTTVDATPDVVANAGHPSNGLALLAAAIHQSEPWTTLPEEFVYCGSVAADGTVLPPVNPIALALQAKALGKVLVMEYEAARTAAYVYDRVLGVTDAAELYRVVGNEIDATVEPISPRRVDLGKSMDLKYVVGQDAAKRALEIAVAGGHHTLFAGAPGGGKTLLASCIPGIAPPLSEDEAIQVAQVHQGAGLLAPDELPAHRPVRCVGSDITKAALLGGGSEEAYYGEVSLASHGWLFADEALQLPKSTLEALRVSLQDRVVHISRAAWKMTFPANYYLICATNPCPCAHWSEAHPERCTCTPAARARYQGRISGALMDRIQIIVKFEEQDGRNVLLGGESESSAAVQARVAAAAAIQQRRQGKLNSELTAADISMVRDGIESGAVESVVPPGLSLRGALNVIKVSRTIADLAGATKVNTGHLSQALELSNKSW